MKVTWIGVTFEVEDQDTMVMGIPTKFAAEMKDLLVSWEGRGYAPLKELRVAAGKAAWLGGVLPRARWLTTVFYAVLTDTLREEEKEKEKGTASGAKSRKGLFPVKRLELARQWAIKFLEAAMQRPLRRIQLREVEDADVRLMTDASPEGLGGVLSINGRVLKAFASPVEPADAEQLGIELGASSSQAILEALAILVGMRHFASYLKGKKVKFTVQADSIAALALTQKLAARAAIEPSNELHRGRVGHHLGGDGSTGGDPIAHPGQGEHRAGLPLKAKQMEGGKDAGRIARGRNRPCIWPVSRVLPAAFPDG